MGFASKKRIKENIPINKYIYTQVLIEHNINQNLHSTNVLFEQTMYTSTDGDPHIILLPPEQSCANPAAVF